MTLDFPIEDQWIEVFAAGEQTDSAGNTKKWTSSDLETIVSKYNSQKDHEAPAVIGHPTSNAPAYGWVQQLKTDGKLLYAKFNQLVPEFVDMLKNGMYKKRSISLYSDLTLRHIGFLGAMPPAIKGLKDIAFQSGESFSIEFNYNQKGDPNMDANELKTKLDELTSKFNDAEKQLNKSKEVNKKLEESSKDISSKLTQYEDENKKLKQSNDELVKKVENFSKPEPKEDKELEDPRFQEQADKIKAIQAELDLAKKTNRIGEFKEYVKGLHTEGKLISEQQSNVIDLMEALHGIGKFNFADGEASAIDKFKAYLDAQPKLVEFKEADTGKQKEQQGKNANDQLNELAFKEAKEKNISYMQALLEVQSVNPDLASKAASEIQ